MKKKLRKAAEFLMDSMANKTQGGIIVDGIEIPTLAELLSMPEEDYMNERQVAFFKHLLREREAQLKEKMQVRPQKTFVKTQLFRILPTAPLLKKNMLWNSAPVIVKRKTSEESSRSA